MRMLPLGILAVCTVTSAAAIAQQAPATPVAQVNTPSSPSAALSPAELRIEAARRQIAADPRKIQAFNDLANAYLRRARETDDKRFIESAADAMASGLKIDANDFQLQKTQVAVMLARGEFAKAKERAAQLNRQTLDDAMVYGYLAEAEIGLGDYAAAETNAQWMLNMLPNDVPGLVLGAKLRVHFGDPDGAIEFLGAAYRETSPTETEELAWLANQIAAIQIDTGKIAAAVATLDSADESFPNYPTTAANRDKARRAQPHAESHNAANAQIPALPEAAAAPLASPPGDGIPAANRTAAAPTARNRTEPVFAAVPAELLTPRPSGTDRLIHKAQAHAAANPKDAKAFAALGAAYAQHARETGDVSDYEAAEQALDKSLDLAPSDFSSEAALESLAEICMGEHRFADALTNAQKALSLGSGNLSPFAIVGDAYADMGEYDKARDAYNKLAPANMTVAPRAAYARDSRLAYLDFVQGDARGAIQLMSIAVGEGTEASIPSENLAWLYYELGEFHAQAGDAESADAAYLQALKIHAGDYRALAGLARLRANHGQFPDAIVLYQKAIAVVPMPVFVSELGDLYERMGNHAAAKRQYDLVEYIGVLGHVNRVLHNRDLALFYADHDVKLGESLELAHKEFEVRHDIYTWDALAWALYKNGKFAEAAKASDEAISFGTRDALLLFHAGMIAGRLGQTGEARSDLKAALEVNPRFSVRYAAAAQQELAALDAGARTQESAVNSGR